MKRISQVISTFSHKCHRGFHYLSNLVTFGHVTYFLLCCWVDRWECLATDGVHKLVIDENLHVDGQAAPQCK